MRTMMMAVAAAGLTVPAATLTVAQPAEAQRYYNGKTWYDSQGRTRCRRNNGTTGLLVGAAGGALKPGRYVDMNSRPATNLFLTMADRLNVAKIDRFGDSTGRLSEI